MSLRAGAANETLVGTHLSIGDLQKDGETPERRYFKNEIYFAKRSLLPAEYHHGQDGPHVPRLGIERLRNEADCLRLVRSRTSIPVPVVEQASEADGVFWLVVRYIHGETLSDLKEEEKAPYLQELGIHLDELHALRSSRLGGPGGLIVPPVQVLERTKQTRWSLKPGKAPENAEYVFCHNDLSEHNILVDTMEGKIKAIVDWEYGGFWPEFFEAPVYTRVGPTKQATNRNPHDLERIQHFLDSVTMSGSSENPIVVSEP